MALLSVTKDVETRRLGEVRPKNKNKSIIIKETESSLGLTSS